MSALFADAMAQLHAVHADRSASNAEDALVAPRLKSGPGRGEMAAPGPDPARPARTLRGQFQLHAAQDPIQGTRRGTELNGMTGMSVATAQFWSPPAELARLPYAIEVGDLITLAARPGAPAYTVVRVDRSDLGDLTFQLVQAKT